MPIRTIKKAKSTKTCAKCKGNVAGSASECQNCGSTTFSKRFLTVVRKSEATGEDASLSDADLETASELSESEDVEDIEDEDDEDDEDEVLTEEDFEPADDEDESEEDDEDSEDDSEEDDEDESEEESDEDEEEEPQVTKRVVRRSRVAKSATSDEILADIALVALTAVDDISKSLGDKDEYEEAMAELNNALDAVFNAGSDGRSISKEDKASKLKRLKAKLASLKAKLSGGGDDDDDDDDVEKSDGDIYRGLTPQAAEIVRKSQELIEKNTTEQFETIAKSYGELPTSTEDLGKALRFISENDPDAYTTITKALAGAANAVQQSTIFKSFGTPMGGEEHQGQTLEAITKSFQDADSSLTPEQALVKAMSARPDLYQASLRG
jgi:hypothetical protein